MKKLIVLLLFASCGSHHNITTIKIELDGGRVFMRDYVVPEKALLILKKNGCLTYTKENGNCYCIKSNVANFKIEK